MYPHFGQDAFIFPTINREYYERCACSRRTTRAAVDQEVTVRGWAYPPRSVLAFLPRRL